MLDAYLDESGIHDGAAVCVIAGYFAHRAPWRAFETDWKRLLYRFKVPIHEFHTKDLFPRANGFFHGWNRHNEFLEAVASTIARHRLIHPIGGGIYVNDFKSFPITERRYFTGANVNSVGKLVSSGCPNKPYFVPFQKCVVRVCGYAPKGGKAHFFFGLDRPFAEYAAALFKQIEATTAPQIDDPRLESNALRERLGTPAFPKAKETPQLQIADFLVNLTYHHVIKAGSAIETAPPSPLLAKCIKNVKVGAEDFFFINRATLEGSLQVARELSAKSALK
jgi:hypothetical protein